MTGEMFFEMLSGLDSRLIEKASEDIVLWQSSQEGVSVPAGSTRRSFRLTSVVAVCAAAAVVLGMFVLIMNVRKNRLGTFYNSVSSEQKGEIDNPAPSVVESDSQIFTRDFDGLVLTVTTDKSTYKIGERINLTASLENNRDEEVYLYYGMSPIDYSVELSPGFEDLIEYPHDIISRDAAITTVTVSPGAKYIQDFTFLTYTDYITGVSETGDIEYSPDYSKPAAPGTHYGKLRVLTCPDKEWNDDDITEYILDFSVTVDAQSSDSENPSQTFTKDFDGLVITVTTDKTTYNIGEPIELTATLENNTGKDITLWYSTAGSIGYDGQKTGTTAELMPYFDNLIEYPVRSAHWPATAITEIPFRSGEKCVQNFTFQTYTGYIELESPPSEEFKDAVIPDLSKEASPGVYYGELYLTVYEPEEDYKYPTLGFYVTINGENSELNEEITLPETIDQKFEAVDPVDNRISYVWEVETDRISYDLMGNLIDQYEFEDNITSLGYLKEFFGNENYLLHGYYSFYWQRCVSDGHFICKVPSRTSVHAPVGGKVISVAEDQEGFGNAVAVEISGGKIYVVTNLGEIEVRVGEIVEKGARLGVSGTGGATEDAPWIGLVIMKKKAFYEKPEQVFTKDFDGLVLTVTTDKSTYELGEPIHLTASIENNTGRNIYLNQLEDSSAFPVDIELMPSFAQGLVEYPTRTTWDIDEVSTIIFVAGEKRVQDFTFQTYTDYFYGTTANGDPVKIPAINSPASPGLLNGQLVIEAYNDENDFDPGSACRLDFSITITSDAPYNTPSDIDIKYTEGMLKDYLIYNGGILYTNCFTYPVEWVQEALREFDFSRIGHRATIIKGKADPREFKNSTANVLPVGTEIYVFSDNWDILLAKVGDEYIPYLKIVEG